MLTTRRTTCRDRRPRRQPRPESQNVTHSPRRRTTPAQPTPPRRDEPSTAALTLAQHGGIGLVGPGATSAARALLLELTADSLGRATSDVLITATTLAALLPDIRGSLRFPNRVHVLADLDTALDQLETITLHRVRTAAIGDHTDRPMNAAAPIILFADVRADSGRLQAILDNGAAIGIGAILLGQWRPGATAHIDLAGHVTATNPTATRRCTECDFPPFPSRTLSSFCASLPARPLPTHRANPPGQPPRHHHRACTDPTLTMSRRLTFTSANRPGLLPNQTMALTAHGSLCSCAYSDRRC